LFSIKQTLLSSFFPLAHISGRLHTRPFSLVSPHRSSILSDPFSQTLSFLLASHVGCPNRSNLSSSSFRVDGTSLLSRVKVTSVDYPSQALPFPPLITKPSALYPVTVEPFPLSYGNDKWDGIDPPCSNGCSRPYPSPLKFKSNVALPAWFRHFPLPANRPSADCIGPKRYTGAFSLFFPSTPPLPFFFIHTLCGVNRDRCRWFENLGARLGGFFPASYPALPCVTLRLVVIRVSFSLLQRYSFNFSFFPFPYQRIPGSIQHLSGPSLQSPPCYHLATPTLVQFFLCGL